MKILFLTQYFPPETGAPQNRLVSLALNLKNKGVNVEILTAMPNYPDMVIHKGYEKKFYVFEFISDIPVHRSFIFVPNSHSFIKRIVNYFSFVFSSIIIGFLKLKKADFIFCESPPLFLGISALLLRIKLNSKLIFNVSDLWPETAVQTGIIQNKLLINLSLKLEEYLYRRSHLISGQTQGIVNNIKSRFNNKEVYWLKNGVDINEIRFDKAKAWREKNAFDPEDFIIIYAGIFGLFQGLETILKTARIIENSRIKFLFIGDGPERLKLENLVKEYSLTNVLLWNSRPRKEVLTAVDNSNAGIVHVKNVELFLGAIPSKIFEICYLKKPLLLGVSGEAKALFIDDAQAGLHFQQENESDLKKKILILYENPDLGKSLGENGHNYVLENFNREKIAEGFKNKISLF